MTKKLGFRVGRSPWRDTVPETGFLPEPRIQKPETVTEMCKKIPMFLILCILILWNMFNEVCAQTRVKLIPEPDIRSISVRSELREIKITAQTDKADLQFEWHIDGPGSLSGDTSDAETFYYIPPDTMTGPTARVTITARTTDDDGDAVTGSLTFTLLNLQPITRKTPETPRYESENEAQSSDSSLQERENEAQSSDSSLQERENEAQSSDSLLQEGENEAQSSDSLLTDNLLKEGDVCFDQQQFTFPKENNAYDIYKKVLKINPENRHAREKIYEMAKIYQSWGRNADKRKNYKAAKRFYQRYLSIAGYVLEKFGDQGMEPDMQTIQSRLRKLGSISRSTVKLLRRGDAWFEQGHFTGPGDNALAAYKSVLTREPRNRHARQKLRDMMETCKTRGDAAYDQRQFKAAESSYQEYLKIAPYALNIPGAQPDELDIWRVQNRLKELEPLMIGTQLEQLEQKLSESLGVYDKLRQEEDQGENVTNQMIPAMQDIVAKLRQIESLYEQFPRRNALILQKTARIRKIREIMENELSVRMSK